jgi:cytochrome c556
MRFMFPAAAAACVLLTACGGEKSSQANNAQANVSADSRPADTAVATIAALPTAAPATKDEALKIMHERHEAMEGLGKAMKALHRDLHSNTPDINAIRAQTSTMAATARKIPAFFPAGTGPVVGKTRAKPEIWQKQDVFIQKSRDFLAAAQAIDAAAQTGDVNKVMAAHDKVDKACKACHDPFRAPEH